MGFSQKIKLRALDLGFTQVGIVGALPSETHPYYTAWLDAGMAGEMSYLSRHAPLKRNPQELLPSAKSVIMLSWNYNSGNSVGGETQQGNGRISQYARKLDYHNLLRERLDQLSDWIKQNADESVEVRPVVDSAPFLEREYAVRAGLGWIGKHSNLIHWEHGSWLFLSGLIVSLQLDPDLPTPPSKYQQIFHNTVGLFNSLESCGTCTACIEACPTNAITQPKQVNATLCISYLTIELKGPIPIPLRPEIGNWLFGCDICQDVCPWNRKAPEGKDQSLGSVTFDGQISPLKLLSMDPETFRKETKNTPLARAKRRGLLRNAAIVLGNQFGKYGKKDEEEIKLAFNTLRKALKDPEPLVRGASAWALGQTKYSLAKTLLKDNLAVEENPDVKEELVLAIDK